MNFLMMTSKDKRIIRNQILLFTVIILVAITTRYISQNPGVALIFLGINALFLILTTTLFFTLAGATLIISEILAEGLNLAIFRPVTIWLLVASADVFLGIQILNLLTILEV